jgi:hypothetical protein
MSDAPGVSVPLLGLYSLASFLHFAHNGLLLDSYPNMPASITASGVYVTWLGIAAAGLTGYALTRLGYCITGLIVLGLYAATGLDGLAHYALAPVMAHSVTMNLTIGFEVVTATLVLNSIRRALRFQAFARRSYP